MGAPLDLTGLESGLVAAGTTTDRVLVVRHADERAAALASREQRGRAGTPIGWRLPWTNLSSGRSGNAGGSTAAPLNTRASPTAPSSRSLRTTRRRLSGSPMHGRISVKRNRAGDRRDQHWSAWPAPGDELRSRRRGCNLGCKLSATERNSEQLRPLESAESQRVRLDRSGWGPGGRRFKSCLPDQGKVLLMGLREMLCSVRAPRSSGTG
jgi:hypothetical protein